MHKDTVLANKTIFVHNGIIKNIESKIIVDDIEIIDGKNQFISPGLIDMHTHLWDKQELGLYLANGVTTIRNLWGYSMHLRLKDKLQKNKIIGPMLFTSSPKLTSKDDFGDDKVQIETKEEAKKLVIDYKQRGFDFIKIYAGINEDIYKTIINQSKKSGISIIAHPSREIPYLDQFNSQVASLEHAEEIVQQALNYEIDSLKLPQIIQKFVDSKKSFCPTITGFYKIYEMLDKGEEVINNGDINYMNPLIKTVDSKVQYNRWANEKTNNSSITETIYKQHLFHLYILKKMNEKGVNIISGTDSGIGITVPGASIHQELSFYKEAGLSNYDALKTATINPTKTHKEFEQMGSIQKGKFANFIVTKKNPLVNLNELKKPEWIMVNGRKVDKITLNKYSQNAKNRNNMVVTALRYLEYLLVER
ncbi:amidohydrolase family protein [Polaribacter ponticola]|uniref:Amidohydrolase family protein n=1 Tax=Polaribacter ponticola TaxID=2978475 RepID=A0ABT5S6K5_9FLAO|nr:amidohydrolase family protein [Polaribacter sp. MSW5]MDD7913731.1 amidohydrolase family protein [Polaribacter sp. MSW5]